MSDNSWEQERAVRTAEQRKAIEAFRRAIPGVFVGDDDFKQVSCLTAPYKDALGRSAEVRLYQSQLEPDVFNLVANLGGIEPLGELKGKLEAFGLKIGSIRKG